MAVCYGFFSMTTAHSGFRQSETALQGVMTPAAQKALGLAETSKSKRSMKELFGVNLPKRNGGHSKVAVLPPILEIHTNELTKHEWIHYSALDAQATWNLREVLHYHLQRTPARMDKYLSDKLDPAGTGIGNGPDGKQQPGFFSMWDLYSTYYLPFGQLLTDMENAGIRVDRGHLEDAQEVRDLGGIEPIRFSVFMIK